MNTLKKQKIWVCWRFENVRGRDTKVPYNARTGGKAMSNNPDTWSSFETATAAADKYNGLGLMFGGGLCGLDIDGADEHTTENPLAAEVIDLFKGTYIERSPSGKGYHILFKCDMSQIPIITGKDGEPKLDSRYYYKNPKNGLECYFSGLTKRYFTYTGNKISECEEITDQTTEVLYFLDKYMKRNAEKPTKFDILDKARRAKNGSKFISLYDKGDISAYNGDDSSADLALCELLAFYLQGNTVEIDGAFRQSALYRPKWERADYRQMTLEKAVTMCGGEFYRGAGRPRKDSGTKEEKPYLTPDILREYFENNGISVRFNVITRAAVIKGVEGESTEQLEQNFSALIYSQIQGNFKGCTKSLVADYIDIIAARNEFNPVLELLDSVQYDGADYLTELYNILHIPHDDDLSRILIKKWLMQTIALLHNTTDTPFGADGCLVLTGRQGIGKTSLFRKLALMPQFFKEGCVLDFRNKDSYISALSGWIAEMGEIETTFKSDIEHLKGFITQTVDEYRRPYARKEVHALRRTSLCGTCNSEQFLIDNTGNRRFWSVAVDSIDLERLEKFNVLQLWKQVEQLVKADLQGFRLTPDERTALDERNTIHEKPLKAQNEIEDILSRDNVILEYMTVTDFKNLYSDELRAYSAPQIGKALDRLGYGVEVKKIGGKVKKLRYLPKRVFKC